MSVNDDIIKQILARVDSITLSNAACVTAEFWSIAKQESLCEEKCCSIWPSFGDTDFKELISSSLGGFRKFYANCFPFIVYDEASERESSSNELKNVQDDSLFLNSGVPSDFIWVVDVLYKNRAIFSKIVWGVPFADRFPLWFVESPFRIDIISLEDEEGLPTIVSVDEVEKDGKFWRQLMVDIKLSWIVINRRTGQAANLSSWTPSALRMPSASDANFLMQFGSILPAQNISPCKFVQCILELKCRFSESDHKNVQIIELSMRLEDMMGDDVNGKNSLRILQRALGCRRSRNSNQIFEFHRKYFTEQRRLKKTDIRSDDYANILWVISGIVVYVSFCYLIFTQTRASIGR